MRIYEASVALDPEFDDRPVIFIAHASGYSTGYNKYKELENKIVEIVLNVLSLMDVKDLEIFYQEYFDDESELFQSLTSDGLVSRDILSQQAFFGHEQIEKVLRYLCRDLGFVTLGKVNKILIIPLERLGFLLCLPTQTSLAIPGAIEVDRKCLDEAMVVYGVNEVLLS